MIYTVMLSANKKGGDKDIWGSWSDMELTNLELDPNWNQLPTLHEEPKAHWYMKCGQMSFMSGDEETTDVVLW